MTEGCRLGSCVEGRSRVALGATMRTGERKEFDADLRVAVARLRSEFSDLGAAVARLQNEVAAFHAGLGAPALVPTADAAGLQDLDPASTGRLIETAEP